MYRNHARLCSLFCATPAVPTEFGIRFFTSRMSIATNSLALIAGLVPSAQVRAQKYRTPSSECLVYWYAVAGLCDVQFYPGGSHLLSSEQIRNWMRWHTTRIRYSEIFVHVGLHKTGSTSIQNFLPLLKGNELKVYVPHMEHLGEFHSPRVEWLSEKLQSSQKHGSKILISNEGILGHYSNFYHERISRLMRFQDTFKHPFTVLFTFREQEAWLQSCYGDYVIGGGTKSRTQFELNMSTMKSRSPLVIAQDLVSALGKDRVKVIDTSTLDAVTEVAKCMGLRPNHIQRISSMAKLNQSLNPEDLERIRVMNRNGICAADRDEIVAEMRGKTLERTLHHSSGLHSGKR